MEEWIKTENFTEIKKYFHVNTHHEYEIPECLWTAFKHRKLKEVLVCLILDNENNEVLWSDVCCSICEKYSHSIPFISEFYDIMAMLRYVDIIDDVGWDMALDETDNEELIKLLLEKEEDGMMEQFLEKWCYKNSVSFVKYLFEYCEKHNKRINLRESMRCVGRIGSIKLTDLFYQYYDKVNDEEEKNDNTRLNKYIFFHASKNGHFSLMKHLIYNKKAIYGHFYINNHFISSLSGREIKQYIKLDNIPNTFKHKLLSYLYKILYIKKLKY